MEPADQRQTVFVDRGLFLIRYTSAKDEAQPPRVEISADPRSNGDVSFVLYPDHDRPILWQPDTCLVVRALAAAKLAVQVVPKQEGGSTAATIRIEPLNQGKAEPPPAAQRNETPRINTGGLRMLGHVTAIGDVRVNAGDWLAGPTAPSRIEGIALEWPTKPNDLDIRYAVKTARPQPISGRAMALGAFAGTRGQAMPIVSVMFELVGAAAADSNLCIEAVFLGSPVARMQGKKVIASGPTGREPLVGLRVSVDIPGEAKSIRTESAFAEDAGTGRKRASRHRSRSRKTGRR